MSKDNKFNDHQISYQVNYIVFFDGYCGLCNWAVDFLILKDKKRKFKYSPLQGKFIKTLNVKIDNNDLDTLYVFDGNIFLSKTLAWRALAKELGGVWKMIGYLSNLIPLSLMDYIYDIISKNRYKIFGKRESCRVPNSNERSLFLD